MIIEFEDEMGNTLGAVRIINDNIMDLMNLSFADVDVDDIFNTNDKKYRLMIE